MTTTRLQATPFIALALAALFSGCATTPYSQPASIAAPPPPDKARVYFIMWTAPDTSLMGGSSFNLLVNGASVAELDFQTYVQYTCDPGEVKMALKGGFGFSEYLVMGVMGGPIGLGLAGVIDVGERAAKSGKNNAATLTAEAGKTYFVEFEPPGKGTKALFKLRTLEPSFAEHRIASCKERKASPPKTPNPGASSSK